jgi:hypothetical protein
MTTTGDEFPDRTTAERWWLCTDAESFTTGHTPAVNGDMLSS